MRYNNEIRSHLYTCHGSSAVVACAKLWPAWVIRSIIIARVIFKRLRLWAHKLCEMGPMSQNACLLNEQNYVNPVCCVATVCHQVRCMYWGHLGHFRTAISHLKWYEIVCMRYLACTFSQMKSINMFSMFLQSGVARHFLWKFIAVWIYNLTVFMFM